MRVDMYIVRKAYRENRMWGDGRLVALWYALRGKSFGETA